VKKSALEETRIFCCVTVSSKQNKTNFRELPRKITNDIKPQESTTSAQNVAIKA
jgi:hypothetical protein